MYRELDKFRLLRENSPPHMATDHLGHLSAGGAPEGPFDPLYQWLGIPPSEQPPNLYRLLGITVFENNPDVIEEAADRQMAHVKSHASGKHSTDSQEVLNKIAQAKICLLSPEKKKAYDTRLRVRQRQRHAVNDQRGVVAVKISNTAPMARVPRPPAAQSRPGAANGNGNNGGSAPRKAPDATPPLPPTEPESVQHTSLLRVLKTNRWVQTALAGVVAATTGGVAMLSTSGKPKETAKAPEKPQVVVLQKDDPLLHQQQVVAPEKVSPVTSPVAAGEAVKPAPEKVATPLPVKPVEETTQKVKEQVVEVTTPPAATPPKESPADQVATLPSKPEAKAPAQETPFAPVVAPVAERPKDTRVDAESIAEAAEEHARDIRKLGTKPGELLDLARKTTDPSQKYATCTVALEKAQAQGDVASAQAAFAELRKNFQSADGFLSQEYKTIVAMARSANGKLTPWALSFMLHACQQDEHKLASDIGRELQRKLPFNKGKGVDYTEARKTLGRAATEAISLQRQRKVLEASLETLQSNPDDPEANRDVGMYGLEVADPRALGYLAKAGGSLGALAARTLQKSGMKAEQLADLAKEWTTATPDALSRGAMIHFIMGLLAEAQQKAEEEGGIAGKTVPEKARAFAAQFGGKAPVLLRGTSICGPFDSVNLMDFLNNLSEDERGKLTTGPVELKLGMGASPVLTLGQGGHLKFPSIKGLRRYTLSFDFMLRGNPESLAINLPIGDGSVTLSLNTWQGSLCSLTRVNGLSSGDTRNPTRVKFGTQINQECSMRVHVNMTETNPQMAAIEVLIARKGGNFVKLTEFSGLLSALSSEKSVFSDQSLSLHAATNYQVSGLVFNPHK